MVVVMHCTRNAVTVVDVCGSISTARVQQ